jgi:hypothetical protein
VVKSMTDALVEAHAALIYARAGLAIAKANGEATVPAHRAAVEANAKRLAALGARPELAKKKLAGFALDESVSAMVEEVLPGLQESIDKYTLIRDDRQTAELLYLGTEGYDDPQPIIDATTQLRDAIVAERDAHFGRGLAVPELP